MDALPEIAWAILLMTVGCVLVVLEVFIPSGGIISILAAVSFIVSIFIAFQPSPTTGMTTGLVFTATTVLAVPTLIALAFKYWPKTPMGKAFLGELPTEEEVLPQDPRRALLGRVGIARSKMLPSGAVEIDGQMVDAVTQGQAIEPGTYVVVSEVRANRVVVRPAGKDQRPSHPNPSDVLSRPIEELGIDSLEDPLA
jgi:membrane-bound serine protease (ClpP class)